MTEAHSPLPRTLVVGGGIAGFSAVLWLRSYGVPWRWIERDGSLGGTLERVHNPLDNYPGANYPNGAALAAELRRQAAALSLAPEPLELSHLDTDTASARFADGSSERFAAVVLATGVVARRLDVPGEPLLSDARLLSSSQRAARRIQAGQARDVLLVGGGDGAVEGALLAARAGARHVILVHRSTRLTAQRRFLDALASAAPHIELRLATTVRALALAPDGRVQVTLERGCEQTTVDIDLVVPKLGFVPHVPPHDPALPRDEAGYLRADAHGAVAGRVWAAGDVASPGFQSVVRAAAQGAHAAHAIAVALGYRS